MPTEHGLRFLRVRIGKNMILCFVLSGQMWLGLHLSQVTSLGPLKSEAKGQWTCEMNSILFIFVSLSLPTGCTYILQVYHK